MEKTFFNANQNQVFIEKAFTSNPAELYSKVIEKLPVKWQPIIENNGEYIL